MSLRESLGSNWLLFILCFNSAVSWPFRRLLLGGERLVGEKVLVCADTFALSISLDFPLFDVSVFKTA